MPLNDVGFLKLFHSGSIGDFPHEAHLRMAWLVLRADGFERGSAKIRAGLRHLTEAHGAPGKYHETITLFWILLVQHAITLTPDVDNFEVFLAQHAHLRNTGLLKRHYSAGLLKSSREAWAAPDLLPLPGAELQHE